MNADDLKLFIASFLTIVGSWVVAIIAKRSAVTVAKVGADEGAFMRAEGIYKNAIERLEKERAEDRDRIEKLENAVRQLKARLTHEGIDVSDLELDI